MEVLGEGLTALGDAIGFIGGCAGFVCIATIAASTFLIYSDKITLEQLKGFFNKDRRFR